jgi:hypothetical protein
VEASTSTWHNGDYIYASLRQFAWHHNTSFFPLSFSTHTTSTCIETVRQSRARIGLTCRQTVASHGRWGVDAGYRKSAKQSMSTWETRWQRWWTSLCPLLKGDAWVLGLEARGERRHEQPSMVLAAAVPSWWPACSALQTASVTRATRSGDLDGAQHMNQPMHADQCVEPLYL